MTFNDALIKLGFSPIEATVFITLIKNGALSGYEVAKLAGLSRSNVYAALYSLQEKGKCYLIEGDTNKYIALSKEELLSDIQAEYTLVTDTVNALFPEPLTLSDPYITIKGYPNVLKKIKQTLLSCESHLYILSTTSILEELRSELEQVASSKRVTIISDAPLTLDHAVTYTKPKAPSGFHMIMDTACVITGDLDTTCQCLYTCNQSLVRLMRESFITELDMIQLTQS